MRVVYDDTWFVSQDMAGSLVSPAFGLDHMYGYSIQGVWTGTPTGTIKLQVSLDESTWTDVAGSSVAVAGAGGTALWNYYDIFYRFVRVVYTRTAGTGSLTTNINAKGV